MCVSYLREVGYPDNVLEARVARINLYHALSSAANSNRDEDVSSNLSSETSVMGVALVQPW